MVNQQKTIDDMCQECMYEKLVMPGLLRKARKEGTIIMIGLVKEG